MFIRITRLLVIAALVLAGNNGEGLVASMPLPPDVALREATAELQLFVVDPKGGRLLFGKVLPEQRLVRVGQMSPVTRCGRFDGVAAIAVRGDRLVVVQGEPAPAVIDCNLETGEVRETHIGEPLRAPTSVAIAADGSIAILDRVLRSIVVIGYERRPTVLRASSAAALIRADDLGQLYVVDNVARGIVPLFVSDRQGGATAKAEQNRVGPVLSLAIEPASFAVYRDVFYVAETTGALRAQIPGARVSLEVPDVRPRQAAITVSRDYLATIDYDAGVVEVMHRPLPAGLLLDPTRGNPNEAWITLLEYIGERRLMSRDRVAVTPEDKTYEALLVRTGVLLKSDINPLKVAVKPGRANRLFCIMNPTLCKAGYNQQLPVVVIPQASPRPVLQTETTTLNNQDVRSWTNDHVLLAAHNREVTDAYLATRNPSVAPTLENELLRRNMVMATPMSETLSAGTVIQIRDGREVVHSRIESLCSAMNPATAKTSLLTRLMAPREAVPDVALPLATDRAMIDIGSWSRSTLSTTALGNCRPAETPSDAYLIVESLAISSSSFAAFNPATEPNFGTVREGPFYVGYRAVPMSALVAGIAVPVDAERVKPLSRSTPSPIWNVRSGSITLPVTRWRTDVLVPSPEFYAKDGALRRLLLENPAIDLSPRERLAVAALTTDTTSSLSQNDEVTRILMDAQTQLAVTINYDEKLASAAGAEDVMIGIVEKASSVNMEHPGFISDDKSAWLDFVQGAGTLQPHPVHPGAAPLTLRRVNVDSDHGTHVAGIIAARQSPALGMLPKTQLFLVPSDSMSDLKTRIQTARDNLVNIFNMSLGFLPATPQVTIQDLHSPIKDSWRDALFIVAAGNDSANLNVTGALAPALWSSTLQNLMTVGASDTKGENLLGQHQDGKDAIELRGSNFGSQYVDLIAPGQTIHSLGRDGYSYACGSSHAAPQVTAVAAMLWAYSTKPEVVRARLLYTADWKEPNYEQKVWGGLLNVKRAILAPKSNVFTRFDDPTPQEIRFPITATVQIDGDIQYRNGSSMPMRNDNFPFTRVLRVEALANGRSRIFLLPIQSQVLTVVHGTVSGTVACQSVRRYDADSHQFTLDADPPVDCQVGVSIGQMKDYVAAMPAAVKFQ